MKIQVENRLPRRAEGHHRGGSRSRREGARSRVRRPLPAGEAPRLPPGQGAAQVLERQFRAEVEGEVAGDRPRDVRGAVRVEDLPVVAAPSVSIAEGIAEGKPMRDSAPRRGEAEARAQGLQGPDGHPEAAGGHRRTVSAELTGIQDSLAQLVPAEGRFEAQEGDWAVIDHEGTIDGQPFEGGKAEGVTVQGGPGPDRRGESPGASGQEDRRDGRGGRALRGQSPERAAPGQSPT